MGCAWVLIYGDQFMRVPSRSGPLRSRLTAASKRALAARVALAQNAASLGVCGFICGICGFRWTAMLSPPISPTPSPTALKFQRLKADASEEAAIKGRARAHAGVGSRGGLCACLSSCCRNLQVASLIESVDRGLVRPLKGTWLVGLKERGGTLGYCHDLPPEAFWSAAELKRTANALGPEHCGLLFVAVSCRWSASMDCAAPEEDETAPQLLHPPDADGRHLATVAAVAKLYLGQSGYHSRSASEKSPLPLAFEIAGLGEDAADFALHWPWATLPALDATHHEPSARAAHLVDARTAMSASLHHWFACAGSVVWLVESSSTRAASAVACCEEVVSGQRD